MRQRWDELLFLHWEVNPELIQATLPAGLTVDTCEGKAYLGVVPFFMRGVRPRWLPAVPGLSNFLECNLRTYVIGPEGPGVWFYSLDCDQPVAVTCARKLFHLSYFHAKMEAVREDERWVHFQTRRLYKASLRKEEKTSYFRYRGQGKLGAAAAGSLDFYLMERYLLYSASFRKNQLYCGRVWHEPYQVSQAEVTKMDHQLIEVAGFKSPDRAPEHVHYSPGVAVEIFGLKKC